MDSGAQALALFPAWVPYAIGALVIMNLGTIGSIVFWGLKISYQLGQRFKELDMNDKANDNKAQLAHNRIDKLENKVWS